MICNTLFLRLEGLLQSWGSHQSKFVIRRTEKAPTKSGVIGLLCAAMGVSRSEAPYNSLFQQPDSLHMGVRIDRPGFTLWDYHTVGAKMPMRIAEGPEKTKQGAMLTRREYLSDASFLVALQSEPDTIETLYGALQHPKWSIYLGRKCCPPSRSVLECQPAAYPDVLTALAAIPWRPRLKSDEKPETLECLIDWIPTADEQEAPYDCQVWYDVPLSFEPPSHRPRYIVSKHLSLDKSGEVQVGQHIQDRLQVKRRIRADYTNTQYRQARQMRLNLDHHLCVFCKSPATTVQHITYRHAGGNEHVDDLRSLCRLCHDAVTMIEYGIGMGIDRINPEEEEWREMILQKKEEIIRFRSLETRRRRLSAEEVE